MVCFGLAWVIARRETGATTTSRGLSHRLQRFISESNAPSSEDQDQGP